LKFSILISNYNNYLYLLDCINSGLNQDIGKNEYEILICDDCSTDNSWEIICAFENIKNIKRFKNNINSGVGYTKKKLVDNSTGDWFLFLDSDDLLKSNCLITFFEKINEMESNQFSLIYANSDYLDVSGNINYWERSKYFEGSLLKSKFQYPIFHPVIYNRVLYNETEGIDINLKSADDFDLWYKMEEVGKILFLPITLYTYRINLDGVSQVGDNNKKWFEIMLEHAVISASAAKRRNLDQRQELNQFAEVLYARKTKEKVKTNLLVRIFGKLKRLI
jgi:glycosyltransferase involved in cell wall biosynthesis